VATLEQAVAVAAKQSSATLLARCRADLASRSVLPAGS
jgi:hypothetical protein